MAKNDSARASAIGRQQLALTILENAPVAILALDLDGGIQHFNPFFERLTGCRLDEVLGRSWFDTFVPERDRERIRTLFAPSGAAECMRGHVSPIVTRTGEERQIEWTCEVLRGEQGNAIGILGIGHDVTARITVEVQHRSVVAAMHDGVVVQGVNGEILDSNLAAQRMLGLSADQLAGRTSTDPRWRCVHEDGSDFPGETHPAMVTLRTGAPTTDVVMGVHRTLGDVVWLSINSEPLLRPDDGAVVGAVTSFSDITDRKRAEATLRLTERRLTLLLDNVTDGFFTLDREWRFGDFNHSAAAMLGRTPEELHGRSYFEVYPEAAGTAWDRAYRHVMATGASVTVEEYTESHDKWFEASVFPFADGISVFFRDISVRKRTEQMVQDERDRLRQIFDAQFSFIAQLSVDGAVIEVNQAPLTLMGLQRPDVLGHKFWEVGWVEPGSEPLVQATIERAARGEPWHGDIVALFPGLGRRDVEAGFSPLRGTDGTVRGVIAVGIDVTERKQVEERLRQAQSLAHVGSWELDFETNRLWWSDETYRILGFDPGAEQPSYDAYLGVVHPDDRSLVDGTYRHAAETGEPYDIQHRLVTADGQVKHARAQVRFIRDESGKPSRSQGTLQDISATVAAELRLREAQSIAKMGNWELDLATNALDWSDEIFRIFEIDPMQFGASYDAFLATIHPDDRAAVDTAYQASVASRTPYEIVHRLLMPDGRLKWVRERGKTHYDDAGRPLRSVGTVHDISTEIASQRSAELLRTVIGGAPVVIFALDTQGVFTFSEGRALEKMGLRPGQMVGASAFEAYGDIPGFDAAFRRALSGEQNTLASHIGSLAFEAAYGPSYDSRGMIDGVIGVGFDVTERVAAEAGLRDREKRLSAIFDHTSDAMLLLSVDASGTLRVTAVNRGFVTRLNQLAQVDEADLFGLTFEELTLDICQRPPEILAQYQESFRRVIDTRIPLTFELAMVFPTGPFFGEVSLVPILDDAGACVQVLWNSRDITARKEAEARVRASLREKETLLREIHHRVKNNLQVIAGLLHFQGKKLRASEDVDAFAELRQRIFAMTLLHERLYQSHDVANVVFCDYVRALVAELVRSFAPREGVRIDVRTTNDVLLPIELAMPAGMVVTELVTNVLKYAFPGTREGTATVSVKMAADRVVLGVDDDGVGLPDGFASGAGSSFGWELVRTLVLQLDGTVVATSDRGAHVRVTFPAPTPAPAQEPS